MASPMYQLTEGYLKPGTPITWTDEHDVSFKALKKALTETATLPHPIPFHPFVLDTDASQICVGAVLQQDTELKLSDGVFDLEKYAKECKNANLRPLAFHSQKLTQTQQRYPTQQRELYAIVSALHQFRGYIAGSPILVRTDHESLKYFQTQQYANPRLSRFLDDIENFNVRIIYRPGKHQLAADAMLRKPDSPEDCDPVDGDEALFVIEEDRNLSFESLRDYRDQLLEKGRLPEKVGSGNFKFINRQMVRVDPDHPEKKPAAVLCTKEEANLTTLAIHINLGHRNYKDV